MTKLNFIITLYYYDIQSKSNNQVWLFKDEPTLTQMQKFRSIKKKIIVIFFYNKKCFVHKSLWKISKQYLMVDAFNPYNHVKNQFDRFLSMKISRNFKKSLTLYILSFSKIKYKHLFYKLKSIFINFYRLFESL